MGEEERPGQDWIGIGREAVRERDIAGGGPLQSPVAREVDGNEGLRIELADRLHRLIEQPLQAQRARRLPRHLAHQEELLQAAPLTGDGGLERAAASDVALPDRLAPDANPVLARALLFSHPALCNDLAQERLEPLRAGDGSACAFPLTHEGQVLGVLIVEGEHPGAFDDADLTALQALADQLAIAIENAKLYTGLEQRVAERTAELRASREQLQAFNRVAARVYGLLDQEQILRTAMEELRRFNLWISVWLLEGEHLVRRYTSLSPELFEVLRQAEGGRDPLNFKVPLREAPRLEPVLHERRTIVVDLKETLFYRRHGRNPGVWEPLTRSAQGAVYAPIVVQDEVIGLLMGMLPQLGPDDIKAVETFALQLSLALENAALFAKLKAAQERMLAMERQAVLGRLAGAVAHEMRNPLGVIRNAVFYLQRLQRRKRLTRGELRENLELIDQEVQRASRIIDELLQLAYRPGPEPEPLRLDEFIPACLARLPLPTGIEVELELTEVEVVADPRQLEQICHNILENAVQAMGGEGRLTVRAYVQEGSAVLEFRDTGPGLGPEELARATEPLFTTKAQGLGLGLTLAEQMVVAHGGRLELESAPGEGCTVRVRLPLTEIADEEEICDG